MTSPRITSIVPALALLVVPVGLPAAPAQAAVPAEFTATVVRTIYTDVDGDGSRDTVTLSRVGEGSFQLAVATTSGATSSVQFTALLYDDTAPKDVFYGASAIDGVKGSELIVTLNLTEEYDAAHRGQKVFTWRKGALVAETAPMTSAGRIWEAAAWEYSSYGYRFFSKHGHRYVDASRMAGADDWSDWSGKVVRSVWRHGGWVKLSTRKVKADHVTRWGQIDFAGPKLLLGQVRADVDGDGAADLVAFYRYALNRYLVRVTTKRKVVTNRIHAGLLDFVGAGNVDGVAGTELIFTRDYMERSTVLTWRSGTLVGALMPATPWGSVNTKVWSVPSAGVALFDFSIVDGVRTAVVRWTARASVDTFVQSTWTNGKWVKVKEWTTSQGSTSDIVIFTVSDLVAP